MRCIVVVVVANELAVAFVADTCVVVVAVVAAFEGAVDVDDVVVAVVVAAAAAGCDVGVACAVFAEVAAAAAAGVGWPVDGRNADAVRAVCPQRPSVQSGRREIRHRRRRPRRRSTWPTLASRCRQSTCRTRRCSWDRRADRCRHRLRCCCRRHRAIHACRPSCCT